MGLVGASVPRNCSCIQSIRFWMRTPAFRHSAKHLSSSEAMLEARLTSSIPRIIGASVLAACVPWGARSLFRWAALFRSSSRFCKAIGGSDGFSRGLAVLFNCFFVVVQLTGGLSYCVAPPSRPARIGVAGTPPMCRPFGNLELFCRFWCSFVACFSLRLCGEKEWYASPASLIIFT